MRSVTGSTASNDVLEVRREDAAAHARLVHRIYNDPRARTTEAGELLLTVAYATTIAPPVSDVLIRASGQ